jgi:hypothetical protein
MRANRKVCGPNNLKSEKNVMVATLISLWLVQMQCCKHCCYSYWVLPGVRNWVRHKGEIWGLEQSFVDLELTSLISNSIYLRGLCESKGDRIR